MLPIEENKSLKELTTLKIGGMARYFVSVSSAAELAEALAFAKEKGVPFTVLGGGSNVLVSDAGFGGLIIKIDINGIEYHSRGTDAKQEHGKDTELVVAGAGENWDALVSETVRRGLWGLENLSGIPGTVGAAPVQNIGAYGAELADTLLWVEVFDAAKGTAQKLSSGETGLGYRESIFKTSEGKNLIVTRVALRLSKTGKPRIAYKDLEQSFNTQFSIFNEGEKRKSIAQLTPLDIRRAVLEIRSRKFPDLKQFGTAGSFFKNPIIGAEQFAELKKKYPGLPGFPIFTRSDLVKISLAWVLDHVCGLKGYRKGNVALFENQPIVLVNFGDASAAEVQAFAREVAGIVKEKTGISIEWEVQRIRC